MNKIIKKVRFILENLTDLDSDKDSEELAYFGLTSKIEHYLRDRIAFNLHKIYGNEYVVSREWKRCDLAILNKDTLLPVILFEFKACYSFDLALVSGVKKFTKAMRDDFSKSENIAELNTEVYSIIFITKPKNTVNKNMKAIIKYTDGINSAFKKFKKPIDIEVLGRANLKKEFDSIEFGHIGCGKAFEINVGFDYGIVKKQ